MIMSHQRHYLARTTEKLKFGQFGHFGQGQKWLCKSAKLNRGFTDLLPQFLMSGKFHEIPRSVAQFMDYTAGRLSFCDMLILLQNFRSRKSTNMFDISKAVRVYCIME